MPAATVQVVYSTLCPSACTNGVDTVWIGADADTWAPVRLYGYPFGTIGLVDQRRLVFLHELGHIFDRAVLRSDDRVATTRSCGCTVGGPHRRTAPKPPLNTVWYGFDPSRRQFAQIVALIRGAAARAAA